MYHSVAKDVEDQLHHYYRTVTTLEQFRAHVDFLEREGYHVVTLSGAIRLLRGASDRTDLAPFLLPSTVLGAGKSPPLQRRQVVLTLGDGVCDFYITAFRFSIEQDFRRRSF